MEWIIVLLMYGTSPSGAGIASTTIEGFPSEEMCKAALVELTKLGGSSGRNVVGNFAVCVRRK